MDESLKKEYEELEQTLKKQLDLLKQDSKVYFQVGGIVLLATLITVGSIKLFSSKKEKNDNDDHSPEMDLKRKMKGRKVKKMKRKGYSFFGNIRSRLFWMAFALGKARLMDLLISKTQNLSGKK